MYRGILLYGDSPRAVKEVPDPIKSEIAEWLAIAQSELGYPAEIIKGSFD